MRGLSPLGIIGGAIPSALWKTPKSLPQGIHPAGAAAIRSSETAKIRLGQVCISKSCGDGKTASRKEEIKPSPHPAPAGAEQSVTRGGDKTRTGSRSEACGDGKKEKLNYSNGYIIIYMQAYTGKLRR